MTSLLRNFKTKGILVICALFVAYTPIKDAVHWGASLLETTSVTLVDISFGTGFPWQSVKSNGYVKVSNAYSQPLAGPQIIYTRFKLSNPSDEAVSFKKIWLTFKHENGYEEYTTDYNLYDVHTRQKLVGNKIQLAPSSDIELLASYRFIPSYPDSRPTSIQISWEGKKQLRDSSCELKFSKLSQNSFGHGCN